MPSVKLPISSRVHICFHCTWLAITRWFTHKPQRCCSFAGQFCWANPEHDIFLDMFYYFCHHPWQLENCYSYKYSYQLWPSITDLIWSSVCLNNGWPCVLKQSRGLPWVKQLCLNFKRSRLIFDARHRSELSRGDILSSPLQGTEVNM